MSNNKYKILVIEDEVNIQNIIETILESNGYQVLTAGTCTEGLMMFRSHLPDLVILDLGLPDADGLNFISAIRSFSLIPVIILSARTMEKDKVTALDLGANDYITKPFGTAELLARVRAALRNSRYGTVGTAPGEKFVLQDLVIDYDRRTITVAGEEVRLTQTEYNIVSLLASHAGKMMTYSAIIQNIWGGNADAGSIKKLQVNMANIRKKLGCRPGDSRYITNELGVGYRMEDSD